MVLKINKENWIKKAKEIHPEYSYDKVEYVNSSKSVIITCPIHGDFSVIPKVFIHDDYKCAKCKKEEDKKKEGEKVINKLKNKFPELDFSDSIYNGIHEKISAKCPIHGEFTIYCNNFLRGKGCPKCSSIKRGEEKAIGRDLFIERAKEIYGDKYNYDKVEYVNKNRLVIINCPIHGDFKIKPYSHLKGVMCPECSSRVNKRDTELFIKQASKKHNNKYDYSKIEYIANNKKVCIICHEKDEFGREHGEFWQTPKNHLFGYGCKKCSSKYLDTELFILKSKKIHGDKYDYSKVDYKNSDTKVCIICPEHGEFWQNANSHLNGRGCPLCNKSHLEEEIELFLKENNINYIYQYRDKAIFKKQSLDFYLPDYNIAIECQGEQHYISNFYKSKGIEFAEKHLAYIQELDENKRNICKENNIELIYFLDKKFLEYEKSDNKCFSKKNELLSFIKNS